MVEIDLKDCQMKLIITGCRDYIDYDRMKLKTSALLVRHSPRDIEVLCGGSEGADGLGRRLACEYGMDVKVFPARRDLHGKEAGMIRNRQMAEYGTHLIAFWDGKSCGTKNMIEEAEKCGLDVSVVRIDALGHGNFASNEPYVDLSKR